MLKTRFFLFFFFIVFAIPIGLLVDLLKTVQASELSANISPAIKLLLLDDELSVCNSAGKVGNNLDACQSITLLKEQRISVGVYDAEDRLLRTLESNVVKEAGTYSVDSFAWDGLDDDGNNVESIASHLKVVANDIQSEWEGVIGNTSSALTGSTVHKEYLPYKDMLIHDGRAYFASGYTESAGSIVAADTDSMARKLLIMARLVQQSTHRIATDGVSMYSAGSQSFNEHITYLQGVPLTSLNPTRAQTKEQWRDYYPFQGDTITIFADTFKVADRVVGPNTEEEVFVTGLAVQGNSDNIFIAREELNSLRVLHKITGELRQDITLINPKHTVVDNTDTLWLVHDDNTGGEKIERFTVNAQTGQLSSTGFAIPANDVQAMAFNPIDGSLAVAEIDAQGHHRIYAYNVTNGSQQWVLGRAENYQQNPRVLNDKFLFKTKFKDRREYSGLAFEKDGSLWVTDPGNNRFVKFDKERNYVVEHMWLEATYSCQVDPNNINRVFAGTLEFAVDYTQALILENPNNAWTLTNNWIETLEDEGGLFPFTDVTTLQNQRTYAVVNTSNNNQEFVELVEGVGLRYTGVAVHKTINLKANGDIYRTNPFEGGGRQTVRRLQVTGFDASNNPLLSVPNPTMGATGDPFVSLDLENSPVTHGSPAGGLVGERFANGDYVVFNGFKQAGYHLAAYRPITSELLFKTAKAVVYPPGSPYPLDGSFDIRESVVNAGSTAVAMDDFVIWGYVGEFWENLQTNMLQMVHKSGLLLHVFGAADPNAFDGLASPAKLAGNAYSPRLVKLGSTVYLWHNDESHHAGLHRWKLTRLNSISEFNLALP